MLPSSFDATFSDLLKAFKTHQDNRAHGADVATLARSSYELHRARMAVHHAQR